MHKYKVAVDFILNDEPRHEVIDVTAGMMREADDMARREVRALYAGAVIKSSWVVFDNPETPAIAEVGSPVGIAAVAVEPKGQHDFVASPYRQKEDWPEHMEILKPFR